MTLADQIITDIDSFFNTDEFAVSMSVRLVASNTTVTAVGIASIQVGAEDVTEDAFFAFPATFTTDPDVGDEITYDGLIFQITKANKPGDGTIQFRARAPEAIG